MAVRIKTDIRRWLQELDKKYFLVMLGFSAFVFFSADRSAAHQHRGWAVDDDGIHGRNLGAFQRPVVLAGNQLSAVQPAAGTHQRGGVSGAGFPWRYKTSYDL